MDPISDMFIRIKNAQKAGHETVQIPYSKFKHEIAKILEQAKLVKAIERRGKRIRKFLEIELAYRGEQPAIQEVKMLSKPSRRLYVSAKNLPRTRQGGAMIISTSRGVMNSNDARKLKIGGQMIAEVW